MIQLIIYYSFGKKDNSLIFLVSGIIRFGNAENFQGIKFQRFSLLLSIKETERLSEKYYTFLSVVYDCVFWGLITKKNMSSYNFLSSEGPLNNECIGSGF